jgi:Partial alpha/beta-hydrolase lipase region
MSASSEPPPQSGIPQKHLDKLSAGAPPALTVASSTSPLQTHLNCEQLDVGSSQPLEHRSSTSTPKLADETGSNPLFPPLPEHYSFITVQFYSCLSFFLSIGFLVFVVLCAMVKTVPSILWVLCSWCLFKDPNRLRPFYQEEKERKQVKTGKLKCEIGYYAQRVGLDCEESKIETEDGFILKIQHIIDRRPGSVDSKRINPFSI